jgi:AraC family transcriptional regulator, activator of mtrCDE
MSRNFMNEIKIKSLAALCNMSVTNFRRVFNSCMGLSPLEHIVKVRIQMASILLNSTDSLILEVALKTGYTTLSSFNRHFKSIKGVSPREWKKAHK